MTLKNQHDADVARLQKILTANTKSSFCLSGAKTASNVTRATKYKEKAKRLDISHFDRLLDVDVHKMQALVEPRMSMQKLIKELVKHGVMPHTLPEFKGITVGGAINGCGGESSSYKVGLFHDNCDEYELLLGSGDKLEANRSTHNDLFEAIHGSYGSLALITSAKIRLTEAKPYVHLHYTRFSDPFEALKHIRQHNQADFLEGIIFSETHAVVIEGYLEKTELSSKKPNASWYYQHAKTRKSGDTESIELVEYLFRYDKGAFWMGAYLLRPKILFDFLTQGALKIVSEKEPWLNNSQRASYAKVVDPGFLVRIASSPLAGSQSLYKLLHKAETWVSGRFIVQDFTLPASTVDAFTKHLFAKCPIYPLWICPVKKAPKGQIFAPNALEDEMCINIGVYGIPNSEQPVMELLPELEKKTEELQGRKWLYANSCYSKEDFWRIYPREQYDALRKKYLAEGAFFDIDEKVINKKL